jgi:hypothetical protein
VDYVVFGIGMGASLVLAGIIGRTLGPSVRYRTSRANGEVLKAEELVARVAWARFCSSLGAALAIGGFFLLIVTAIAMALRLDDTLATVIVGLALFAVIVLMALWTWAFVNRFGLYGIVAERPRKVKQPSEPRPEKAARETHRPRFGREKKQKEPEPIPDSPIPSIELSTANGGATQPAAGQAKRTFKPWSTPAEAEPVHTESVTPPAKAPRIDPSRSEVINPSDAAALERILSEPDPVAAEPATAEPTGESKAEPEGEEVTTISADEQAASGESEPALETTDEPTKDGDSSSIPAAPWNRRKQQRR